MNNNNNNNNNGGGGGGAMSLTEHEQTQTLAYGGIADENNVVNDASSSRKRPLLSSNSNHDSYYGEQHHSHRHHPQRRPRTTTFDSQSNVQEAANGMIGLATTAPRHFHPPPPPPLPETIAATSLPATATPANILPAAYAPTTNNITRQIHDSVVHLSITKAQPSFTEPWRKFPPVSLVGTGVIISWKENTTNVVNNNNNNSEGFAPTVHRNCIPATATATATGRTRTTPAVAVKKIPGGCGMNDGINTESTNNNSNNNNNNNNTNNTIRILTNANTVQYATCIRARTNNNPISVGCVVEWISLAMDLALLKITIATPSTTAEGRGGGIEKGTTAVPPSGWSDASSTHPPDNNLPCLGEGVSCVRFPTVIMSERNNAPGHYYTQRYGRHGRGSQFLSRRVAELDVRRGTVAGFYADENAHHMLRMKMHLSTPPPMVRDDNDTWNSGGGGLVVNDHGQMVGLVASISSSSQSEYYSGVHDIIPGVVVDRFLDLCNHNGGGEHSGSCCDGVCDASAAVTSCHVATSVHNGMGGGQVVSDGGCESSHSEHVGHTSSPSSSHHNHQQRPSSSPKKHGTNGHTNNHKSNNASTSNETNIQRRCLPGIPTLNITGFQSLENGALRRTLGLSSDCDNNNNNNKNNKVNIHDGIRILGINHTVHPTIDNECQSSSCKEDKKCNTSMLRTDDVLLAVDDVPIRLDGTAALAPGREDERVDFRWLVARRHAGMQVELDIVRHKRRMTLTGTLSAPKHLVPRCNEGGGEEDCGGGGSPSYVICGGCVFVPLTRAWLEEMEERRRITESAAAEARLGGRCRGGDDFLPSPLELQGFQRYLEEQRRGDQQVIVLSHVLPDEVNVGYHGMRNMVLTSVNGQRPINNMSALLDLLVKRENGPTLEFRCSYVHLDRAKVVICMDAKEVMDSETRIMSNYMIDACCSNALSPELKKEARGKARRHGAGAYGLKTMRALQNAVRETTLVVRQRPSLPSATAAPDDNNNAVAATRRIMDFSEAHKMQSAPLFAGKYTEEGGWTQVKTKHLSQLCTCGKSTRFYCICSVGVMRCKDCFIKHCRDHTNGHECTAVCPPSCDKAVTDQALLAEGVELVTTKKRKRNNPTQAIQSRCVVCKAKTCYCCSACGFEKEVALCHVSTGRNCLTIHASEHHSNESKCIHVH